MKLTADDPRLTAYAFGELSPQEMELVSSALERQPDLRKMVAELGEMETMLSRGFGSEPTIRLKPEQRIAIHRAGRQLQVGSLISLRHNGWKRAVAITLAAAATVAFCFIILKETKVDSPHAGGIDFAQLSGEELGQPILRNDTRWGEPMPATQQAAGGASSQKVGVNMQQGMRMHAVALREEMKNRALKEKRVMPMIKGAATSSPWLELDESKTVRLPLIAGNTSWQWVKRAILDEGKLPQAGEVRFEEILNSQQITVSPDYLLGGIATTVELLKSPTADGNLVALLSFSSESAGNPMVEAGFSVSPQLASCRIVGYDVHEDFSGRTAPAAMQMQKGYNHHVLLELKPHQPLMEGDKVLTLHLHVAGEEDLSRSFQFEYSHRDWNQASEPMQFALTLRAWSDFLQHPADTDKRNECLSLLNRYRGQHDERAAAIKVIQRSLEL